MFRKYKVRPLNRYSKLKILFSISFFYENNSSNYSSFLENYILCYLVLNLLMERHHALIYSHVISNIKVISNQTYFSLISFFIPLIHIQLKTYHVKMASTFVLWKLFLVRNLYNKISICIQVLIKQISYPLSNMI